LNQQTNLIADIKISFSGLAPFPHRALKTELFLKNKTFSLKNIQDSFTLISEDFPPDNDSSGGYFEVRKLLSSLVFVLVSILP
jgi:xanthine dehydrogenase iron-sulfur cluster and FAD-binding subunit A